MAEFMYFCVGLVLALKDSPAIVCISIAVPLVLTTAVFTLISYSRSTESRSEE